MMAPYVEANSLSDITQLASNPPKYPRNPTEKQRLPLTLYIARVPGSRDVILTTLKPQLKNVTAGDVASSLYYFHLNSDDDAQLFAEDPASMSEVVEPSEREQKPLLRKPVPESSKSSIDANRSLPSVPQPVPSSKFPEKVTRKALLSETQPVVQPQVQVRGRVERRPLGPRPLLTELSTNAQPLQGIGIPPQSSGNPVPNSVDIPRINIRTTSSRTDFPEKEPLSSPLRSKKAFSITVIRRDPSSGAQWNVGAILGEEQPSFTKSSHSKKPYFDISVHLSNPGYTQFREPQTINSPRERNSPDLLHQDMALISEGGFDRSVRMEGSSIWDRPKQHKRSQSDTSGILDTRRGSDSTDNISPGGVSQRVPSPDGGPKGYVFTSPWGGRCKFLTSSSGRSLKCNHTLPKAVSSNNTFETGSLSRYVSELRFNLPSLDILHTIKSPASSKDRSPGSSRFKMSKLGNIRNKLSPEKVQRPPIPPRPHPTSYASLYPSDNDDESSPRLPPRPLSNSYGTQMSENEASSDEDEGRLDLSIGQEKAGGGNRGKRVKLGKLIILDEGYKMLDLVVAANIGVWWSVWESNS